MNPLIAALYDPFMLATEQAGLGAWRAAVLAEAEGRVLEIGAGTGVNLSAYPAAVTHLTLCEPCPNMRRALARRLTQADGGPEVVLLDAEAEDLPLASESMDAAVTTLVLCSVADPTAALAELHRVLRPGGKLLFIEHVAAHDSPGRLAWQRRLEPLWRPLAGNCHLTRATADDIEAAGFTLHAITRESMRATLPWIRPSVRGVAIKG